MRHPVALRNAPPGEASLVSGHRLHSTSSTVTAAPTLLSEMLLSLQSLSLGTILVAQMRYLPRETHITSGTMSGLHGISGSVMNRTLSLDLRLNWKTRFTIVHRGLHEHTANFQHIPQILHLQDTQDRDMRQLRKCWRQTRSGSNREGHQ